MRVGAIDIGSTAVKSCLFDLRESQAPELVEVFSARSPLLSPRANYSEHNLAEQGEALETHLARLPEGVPVGFTSAMHGLVLLDERGKALCNAISWADVRSSSQVERLRPACPDAQLRTGTPLHPMAWPSKLLWLQQSEPTLWQKVRRVTDLKSYHLERLTGRSLALDVSSASGTGLWNQQTQEWDPQLLDFLNLCPSVLPDVSLTPFRWEWNNRTLTLGAGDGPMGNLGTGATQSGSVALSLGTSGAVRTYVDQAGLLDPRLFRYHLTADSWVEGGALSNGGSVLEWLIQQEAKSVEEIFRIASKAPIGANKTRVYPYFQGERAPFWRPDIQPRVEHNTARHTFADLCRATLEGVAFCLNRLILCLPRPKGPLRCTGGMFASTVWSQMLADVTGLEVALSPVPEATSLGAALLCTRDPLERSRALPLGSITEPTAKNHEIYAELYSEWAEACPGKRAEPN